MVSFAKDYTFSNHPSGIQMSGCFLSNAERCSGIKVHSARSAIKKRRNCIYYPCYSPSLAQGGDANEKSRCRHFWEGAKQTLDIFDAIKSARQMRPSRTNPTRVARPIVVAVANFGMGLGKMAEAVFNQYQNSTMPESASEMWAEIDRQAEEEWIRNLFGEDLNQFLEDHNLDYDHRKEIKENLLDLITEPGG